MSELQMFSLGNLHRHPKLTIKPTILATWLRHWRSLCSTLHASNSTLEICMLSSVD
jgi:hypothetical protein